jgi:hypothetical protein
MTDKELFIEERLLNSLKSLLTGRVNELLGEMELNISPIEFIGDWGGFAGDGVCSPVVRLSAGERTEKERIVRVEAYTLTIGFSVAENPEAERRCYAYAAAVDRALGEDPTLGGAADRAALTGKRYEPPKRRGAAGAWEVMLTVRITAEEMKNEKWEQGIGRS